VSAVDDGGSVIVARWAQRRPHRTTAVSGQSMTSCEPRWRGVCRRTSSRSALPTISLPFLAAFPVLVLLATAASAIAEPVLHSTPTTAPHTTGPHLTHSTATRPAGTTTAPPHTTAPHTAATTPHPSGATAPHTTPSHSTATTPSQTETTTKKTGSKAKAVHHTLRYIAGGIVVILIGVLAGILLVNRRRHFRGLPKPSGDSR
jgi:hypothetical protein